MSEECTLEFDGRSARLGGALTFGTCADLFHEMERRRDEDGRLERIDLSGVSSADSAGLALLLEWQARAGGTLSITGAPSALLQLARLCEAVEPLRLTGRESC